MKSNYLIYASSLLISVSSFAQKEELKAAEKAFKKGNSTESITILTQSESVMTNADEEQKAQYYFLKGNAYLDLAIKNGDDSKNLLNAANAYITMLAIEKKADKSSYTSSAKISIADLINRLINSAIVDSNAKNFKPATEKIYAAYELNTKDTEKLYYAANFAVSDKDYDAALKYYIELKNMNYTGEATLYYATSIVNDKEEYFGNTNDAKKSRDEKVKMKLYVKPRDEKSESKKGEIYRNIALILVQQGKVEEAKKALADAVAANPNDVDLQLEEANLYLKLEDYATYKKIISQVLAKNPKDATLLFNMGVIASKTNPVEAEDYYKKAIEIDPSYINAYLNLSILILDKEKGIIDEINKLGNTEKDNKRYEVLKKELNAIYLKALPYLEKAHQLDKKNEEVATALLSVYGALEMTEERKALKATMGQ